MDAPASTSARCGAHRQGKFALGGSVGLSVGRSVGSGPAIDLPSWSVSCRVVCACWGSVFPGSRNQDFFVSALVCVRRSVCGCVSVRLLAQFLRRGTPLFFPSVLSFVLVCARAVMGSAGVVLASVSASASAGSSGGCCWWERSRAHARVLSSAGSPWRACGDARCGVGCGASRLGGPRIPTADGRGSIDRSAQKPGVLYTLQMKFDSDCGSCVLLRTCELYKKTAPF